MHKTLKMDSIFQDLLGLFKRESSPKSQDALR